MTYLVPETTLDGVAIPDDLRRRPPMHGPGFKEIDYDAIRKLMKERGENR